MTDLLTVLGGLGTAALLLGFIYWLSWKGHSLMLLAHIFGWLCVAGAVVFSSYYGSRIWATDGELRCQARRRRQTAWAVHQVNRADAAGVFESEAAYAAWDAGEFR